MSPITEDQVLSLMKGLEDRERAAMKKLGGKVPSSSEGGRTTARVLEFSIPDSQGNESDEQCADVVELNAVREARRETRTLHGHFVFLSDPILI